MRSGLVWVLALFLLSSVLVSCGKEDREAEVKLKLAGDWIRTDFNLDGNTVSNFAYRYMELNNDGTYLIANDSAASQTFTGTWSVSTPGTRVSLTNIISSAELIMLSNTELTWEYSDDAGFKQETYLRQ